MKAIGILLLEFLLSSSGGIQPTFGPAGANDFGSYPPSDYFTSDPPERGGSYTDPVFGIRIKRISDALQTVNESSGGNLISIITEYPSVDPFNMNRSRLILVHESYFGMYDGDGNYLQRLPFEISASSEPRWSRRDPDLLYYHAGNQLKQYNVRSREASVVRTFEEYSTIDSRNEADISMDGDHMVLVGDAREIFIYELKTDSKGSTLDTEGRGFDSVYVSPRNNVIVSWSRPGTDRFTGVELYTRDMAFSRQLTRAGGHMDVTVDASGEEVLVWFNSGDPGAICENGIVKVRLATGEQTCLLTLDRGLAGHISATDRSWVLAETYAPADPDPAIDWKPFMNEIFLLKVDGSAVRRLATHRSRPFNVYNYQPRATISRDGRRVVFSSNYGLQARRAYPGEYSDAYLAYVW
jgi:Tol biopolymer transport system component